MSSDTWPTAFSTLTIVSFWIIGIAVSTGWALFFAIIFPPAAWVFAAKFFLERC